MNDPLFPALIIVTGLALLAVLFRLGDLRKRQEPLHRIDDVVDLLEDTRKRIRSGEEVSPETAHDLRRRITLLEDVLERFTPPERYPDAPPRNPFMSD